MLTKEYLPKVSAFNRSYNYTRPGARDQEIAAFEGHNKKSATAVSQDATATHSLSVTVATVIKVRDEKTGVITFKIS